MTEPSSVDRRNLARLLLFTIFAFSGVAGLIYETVWSRYIKLFLGHSAYAQTYVIAVFMGGMAIGSYVSARYSTRIKSLLKGYAYVEFAIGLFAIAFQPIFEFAMSFAYDSVLPGMESPLAIAAFKQTLSIGLLLPACIMLGMTFPLMSGGVIRLFPDTSGAGIANLYFTNSIGAAAGVLLTGFIFIDAVGLPGTMLLAAALNILIGLVVLLIAKQMPEPPLAVPQKPAQHRTSPRLLLAVAAFTGLASFVYEIAWIRMLSMLLGSSSHAFELMLATFIAGLAFGGLWIKRRIDRLESPERFLAAIQWVMGVLAIITVFIYGPCFTLMSGIMEGLARTDSGYVMFNILSNAIAVIVMFPAAFCAGTTLPLITMALLRRGYGERSIGTVYSVNTLGSIAGVVLATHVGLPLLGLKGLVCFGAAVDILAGLALFLYVGSRRLAIGGTVAATAFLAAALFGVRFDTVAMSAGVFRHGLIHQEGVTILSHEDGKAASITVYDNAQGLRSVVTNGKPDASVRVKSEVPGPDEVTQDLLGIMPLALHPDAKHAAVIGFGSGMTTHHLLANPGIEQLDTIEIEREMLNAGQFFRPHNERAFTDPRSNLVVDDARSYFSARHAPYDIIVSEPSNPWVSGVSSLFTKEFYAHIHKQLADDGVLVQWLQLYELDATLVASIMQSLEAHFPYYTLFSIGAGDFLIAARKDRPVGALRADLLSFPGAGERLAQYGVTHINHLELLRIGSRPALSPYWNTLGVPPNSDYFPFLDARAAHARFVRASATEISQPYPLPVYRILSRAPDVVTNWLDTPYLGKTQGTAMPAQVRAGHDAVMFARRLLDLPLTEEASLPPMLAQPLNRLRKTLTECDPVPERELNQLLFAVAKTTMPWFSPQSMAPIWTHIKASECHGERPESYRKWVEFFAATSARDPAAMTATAQALIADPGINASWEGQMLLAGALTAAVLRGDVPRAQALFREHANAVVKTGEIPFVYHLIMAHAVAPPS